MHFGINEHCMESYVLHTDLNLIIFDEPSLAALNRAHDSEPTLRGSEAAVHLF